MQVNDTMARYVEELIGKLGTKKGKKSKNQADKTTLSTQQTNPAYNLSLSGPRPPIWEGQWTKRPPAMTDEEFEKKIAELGTEFAERSVEIGNSGKSASMINKELKNLRDEFENRKGDLMNMYVSVVSPDRKTAYAKADFTKSPIVYGEEKDYFGGNELMRWSPSGWGIVPTAAEMERMGKFDKIFGDMVTAYEKENGIKVPYTTIGGPVAPVKNYL